MRSGWSRILVATGLLALVGSAQAQDAQPESGPSPAPAPAPAFTAPPVSAYRTLTDSDVGYLRDGIAAARAGDITRAQSAQASLTDPVARKIVLWAMVDAAGDRLSFFQVDQARRDLWGWPRASNRQSAVEKQLETSGLSPQDVVKAFAGSSPQTAQGAMALASAYRAMGRTDDAQALIRQVWRTLPFEADIQRTVLARFGDALTVDDHVKREDMLLYGPQGPASRDMIALLPADQQALSLARIAFRTNAGNADSLFERLPASVANDPGLTFERARFLRQHGLDTLALGLVGNFPTAAPHPDSTDRVYAERRQLFGSALKAGDYPAALAVMSNSGAQGADLADAEFCAGWVALQKLKNPTLADLHFEKLQRAGASPITKGRALYWRGRAAEARGDEEAAMDFSADGARFSSSFYGQLAAERAGVDKIKLGHDPAPSAADRARFNGRELVQAVRMLSQAGQRDLVRSFVLVTAETLPKGEESALLVDLAQSLGDQDLAMRVVRTSAQRGFLLPERGYPIRTPPIASSAEPAFILSITRQESGFDPMVRSGVGARGMMQLMPTTARIVAARAGMSYSPSALDDPDYNMRLGALFLGQMVDTFSGSYPLAAAAYNAGPNRASQWVASCGDPRNASTDPADFIECIPISETRNYVMRAMESMAVYRARLNGGSAPLTPTADLKRGRYGAPTQLASAGMAGSANAAPPSEIVASTPVPNLPETVQARPPAMEERHERPSVRHGRGASHAERSRKGSGRHKEGSGKGAAKKAHGGHGPAHPAAHGKKHKR